MKLTFKLLIRGKFSFSCIFFYNNIYASCILGCLPLPVIVSVWFPHRDLILQVETSRNITGTFIEAEALGNLNEGAVSCHGIEALGNLKEGVVSFYYLMWLVGVWKFYPIFWWGIKVF